MLSKTKIALSLGLVLATASGATAAGKHPVRSHRPAIARPVSAAAYQRFGSGTAPVQRPLYLSVQSFEPYFTIQR
jgi:hypothetical protein